MLGKIAAFEFRYQLRSPWLWTAAVFVFGIAAFSMSVDLIDGGDTYRNSSWEILNKYLAFSAMFMFVSTAFVANVVIRDDETGFGPILRSTRIGKADYLIGRFLGAFAVTALCLLLIPLGLLIGSVMPWVDPATIGPHRIADHLYGYFLLALPNTLFVSAILFTLASLTRSAMGTYVGVVGFVICYLMLNEALISRPQVVTWIAVVEPFARRAITDSTRYWTLFERNNLLPPLEGALLWNRLLWLGISSLFLGLAAWRYRFADKGLSERARRRRELPPSQPDRAAFARAIRLPSPSHGLATAWAVLRARIRFEMKQVAVSPAFILMILWGMSTTLLVLLTQRDMDGRPSYPTTASMIPELENGLFIIPALIVVIYAGELVWNERTRRMHEIVDSTALPNWAYAVPKILAVVLVLASIFAVNVLASMAVQLSLGFTRLEAGQYALFYLLPATADMLILTVLAVFVHALSPHKIVGWGIMILFILAQSLNLMPAHPMLNYGATLPVPLSDFIGADDFWVGAWTMRLYWGTLAIVLLVAAHLLWRRGTDISLRHRLRLAPRRLAGAPGWIAGAALTAFAATGAYAWHNINVVNHYRSADADEAGLARFEKKYGKYRDLPQPAVTDVRIDVALYPRERRAEARGRYTLRNVTDRPIGEVHLRKAAALEIAALEVAGGRLVERDPDSGYRIYRLDRPMQPGEERVMTFRTVRARRGFAAGKPDQKLVENGTYLDNGDLAPSIGFAGVQVLEGNIRARYGLPDEPRVPRLEDEALYRSPGFGSAWARTDIRLSTDLGQVPIATGRKVSDVTAGGRRTARFVSAAPVRNFFSVHSGRYAERHRLHRGRDLAVYYHPAHAWNVDRMLDALQAGMDHYEKAYGPYPFTEARLVEFGWAYYARAFPGTIPYSEDLGFVPDLTDPDIVDNVSGVVMHELAHQYWGHQLTGAPMQGSAMLSEPLATWSAMMALKRLRGPDENRRMLQVMLWRYLGARDSEAGELPLARVENQTYVHSSKGPLAMYLLGERLGEERVSRALRRTLERFRFRSDLYPRSLDLIAAFRAEARNPEEQALITDLFERITLYDLKAEEAKAVRRADGKWEVAVAVRARKYYADGKGAQTEARLDERIEIGLFTTAPGGGPFDRRNVILMRREPVRSGRQVLKFVTDRKPLFAGIDPYNFYIDRDSADNVAAMD